MNIVRQLNEELLKQAFIPESCQPCIVEKGQRIASFYAHQENAIAVLSDLKSKCSYLYYGGISETLGLAPVGTVKVIHSIWEEDIFSRIHPDDLLGKHILELEFFYRLRNRTPEERNHYYSSSCLRIRHPKGAYVMIRHRMFYLVSDPNGSIRLALCLYSFPEDISRPENSENLIINSLTGEILRPDKQKNYALLSAREKEILGWISQGKTSKEIAEQLFISIHTVNRHRQNILEKLGVKNSMEACRLVHK